MRKRQAKTCARASTLVGRLLLALLVTAAAILAPSEARAAGTVQISTREPVEEEGKWKLKFTIDHGGAPPIGHVPMLFSFQAMVLYERALMDKTGEKPIVNKIPLQNQQPIIESLDVGFADASGKIFAKTKFDFVIRRDRGFEAGEYELKIKRAGDGVQMGQPIRLILKGDNPIVDRRAIVFAGEKKKKPEGEKTAQAAPPPSDPKEDKVPEPPPGGWEPKPDSAVEPPPVEPKQGGCGCRVVPDERQPVGLAVALGLGVAAALGRSARSRARARKRGVSENTLRG
jgi:hypothetical protein